MGEVGISNTNAVGGRQCALEWSNGELDVNTPFLGDLAFGLFFALRRLSLDGDIGIGEVLGRVQNLEINGLCTDLCVVDNEGDFSSCVNGSDVPEA